MALDFLAIGTIGAYPTPTPTDAVRYSRIATWGFLGVAPVVVSTGLKYLKIFGSRLRKIIGG